MEKLIGVMGILYLFLIACNNENSNAISETAHVEAASQIEAGRYLAIVAGCNDCHTHEYLMREGQIPEQEWFAGSPMGWRGPWGTTYASNLRLRVQEMSEDAWVNTLHTRNAMPPMPWFNVKNLSDQDARALYQYIKSLGPKGEKMPAALSPGKEPQTPYLSLIPQNLPQDSVRMEQ
jgi:mono/diheme cytochrome c family protein